MNDRILRFSIDRTVGIPAYQQIVEQVKDALHAGKLDLGDHLPSVSEVVKSTAINANTVMKAYQELEFQKIVVPRQGIGTIVTSLPKNADPPLLLKYRKQFKRDIDRAASDGLSVDAIKHLINDIIRDHAVKEAEVDGNQD